MLSEYIQYMKRALDLAELGSSTVSPNPLVGAILVKNGKIIGEGFHKRKGEAHAEVLAIENATENVEGSTLFCTLEPCCHTNKSTPPCIDLILRKKIKKVVIATRDPNPMVAGKGIELLKDNKVEVVEDILKEEAIRQNEIFFKNMLNQKPFIHIKVGSTLDGRIATDSGDSKWITSEYARQEVHELRKKYDAVMIGKNTLRNDNPRLNARADEIEIKEGIKIIVGDLEERDLNLNIFKSTKPIINIYNNKKLANEKIKSIKRNSSWDETFKDLFKLDICSVLIEGGSILVSSLLKEGEYDRATFYLSPKIIGNGPSLFNDKDNQKMDKAIGLNGKWRILRSQEAVLEVEKQCLQVL